MWNNIGVGERILIILTLTVNSEHEKGLFAVNNYILPHQMLLQWFYLP
jgi:ATP-dependent phosphoenolpyruvate carboxykinase